MSVTDLIILVIHIHDLFVCTNICRIIFKDSIEAVDDFNDRIEQNEIDIEIIYSANFTEIEEELENLNLKHDELRNDFNSFTVDISKWQIDTDRRIVDAENDISGQTDFTLKQDFNSHGKRWLYPPRNEVAVYCQEILLWRFRCL